MNRKPLITTITLILSAAAFIACQMPAEKLADTSTAQPTTEAAAQSTDNQGADNQGADNQEPWLDSAEKREFEEFDREESIETYRGYDSEGLLDRVDFDLKDNPRVHKVDHYEKGRLEQRRIYVYHEDNHNNLKTVYIRWYNEDDGSLSQFDKDEIDLNNKTTKNYRECYDQGKLWSINKYFYSYMDQGHKWVYRYTYNADGDFQWGAAFKYETHDTYSKTIETRSITEETRPGSLE